MTSTDSKTKAGISTRTKNDNPPMYKVILHNDDYTSMEFVVEILMNVFGKSLEKATQMMLNIHNRGKEICGIYPRQIAETKVETVHHLAGNKGFPLKSTLEKE
jgi:ATP-dependent Clp protease adaptor protein ClpS